MSYVVLARKWRPMRFEDLVGQDHVSRTLGNAIDGGRVAHAFLFTGVRGVGKTTSARILAKALCCLGDPDTTPAGTDPGPTIRPCLKCAACLEIAQGSDVDVREIDGASYNGVDEVRKLQDSLPYRPARDRFKIFIIDEVHMLSTNAWNAFLKTLEEPPPHVKFIFATTEVHKVPITILSRVQRFDFKLIPTQMIVGRLRYVLDQEKIESDDAALGIIAREAAGSMRDAMSLLDQVIAWGGAKLTGEDVARVLGVASRKVLHDIAGALVSGDAQAALAVVSELANQGYDTAHVARDLLGLLRDLVVGKVCKEPGTLLDLADEEARDITELAKATDADDLIRLHQGFSQGFDDVVRSGQPRAALEMLLVRLARRPPLLPIDELVRRLAALEQRLGAPRGAQPSAQPGRPQPQQSAPQRQPAAPDLGARAGEPRPREARAESARPEAPTEGRKEPPPCASQPPEPPPREPAPRLTSAAPAQASRRVAPAPDPDFVIPDFVDQPEAEKKPPVRAVPALPRVPQEEPKAEAVAAFRAILDRVNERRPELAAFLARAAILDVLPGELKLGWEPGGMFSHGADDKESQDLLASLASEQFGVPTKVSFEFESARAKTIKTLATIDSELREQKQREAVAQAKKHRGVTDAVEVLGARIKDLKLGPMTS
ncbi:MAG TPA: DNA polymerase III subunit gamma/tau [Polyangiaceae bacterium]|nr:DNA polymerase III subunit gamma/tau [Polyangiaceae bacterium]